MISETFRAASATSRGEGTVDIGGTAQKETSGDMNDALLSGRDFDSCLSQEI